MTTIYGKTNQSVTNGNIGNGCNDIALDILTNRVYVTKATQAASELAVFRDALGTMPLSALDPLAEPDR